MTITMYGIPNCDTIKKARKWLEAAGVDYQFHDYRKQGIDAELVAQFCQALGWENVLNKRGTTFRQLTHSQKESLDAHNAVTLLVEQPAMIKRPILLVDTHYHLGFNAQQYATIFS
ncbi:MULTISPECIES: ArsC family reductase [unclassified Vibrio]|uniref:ArsC family reductase n=1 Tax=unclassified Vibrio TaxID=2614977 RepID=UPI000B8ED33A|nr:MULTISPECIES: ArsC family reductase [unclassified Vibrio]NAX17846.1 ArsC family reductase [Vibrio sp. V22_P2S10T140]OXX43063.1 ArsC family reductase [Vibrio sp. V07_P2A8T137]OXX66403.1 ArsC family reductase [Vibrio sp. V10_P2A27P122]PSD40290.1 ArsC family reductase [Vibrio sp. V02_P2A34T13]